MAYPRPVGDDGNAAAPRRRPLRRCIVTGEVRPQAELIRFVIGPDRVVVPDLAGRLPGRGLWLTPRRDIVAAACGRNRFSWASRRAVRAAEDLDETVARLLVERCQGFLGLARRAGQAVVGFERVRAWLKARDRKAGDGRGCVLLAAADGGEDGVGRLAALAAGASVSRIALLTGAELGRGLGRARVVHAALAPGRLAEAVVAEAGRLAGFRRESVEDVERDDGYSN